MTSLESLYMEYDELRLDLRGISPKLSLHASLTGRLEALKARIDALEDERRKANQKLRDEAIKAPKKIRERIRRA